MMVSVIIPQWVMSVEVTKPQHVVSWGGERGVHVVMEVSP